MDPDAHDAVVRRSFERQTGLFEGPTSPFASRATSPAWVGPLSEDLLVLDVACGAAHVAEQLAPSVRQVVGLDLTPELLALGAARLREAGVRNVLLQQGDAADLPFLDASFDVVVSRSALHHFPDPAQPVAEMARVCRPGGRVAVADMVAPSGEVRARFDELHRLIDPSHAGALLEAELVELLGVAVGPATPAGAAPPLTLPLDLVLTDVADRAAVVAALRAELAGGAETGFAPALDDDALVVSFTTCAVQAVRAPEG